MLEILFCLVVGISDGDTLTARCGEEGSYEQIKVRLVAIDAPERKQPFGTRSRQHLSDLCFQQTAAITVHYSDRWGRKVADVGCNGIDAGTSLVSNGLAWVYPQFAKKHEHLYDFQDKAKLKGVGLWSVPNPIPPWEWRKGRR